MTKPRDPAYRLRSAGCEESHARARALRGMPFDPFAVPVRQLEKALAAVDNPEAVHRLQRYDTRTSAAAHYERRINAITKARKLAATEE